MAGLPGSKVSVGVSGHSFVWYLKVSFYLYEFTTIFAISLQRILGNQCSKFEESKIIQPREWAL